jgi:hypothetical protein
MILYKYEIDVFKMDSKNNVLTLKPIFKDEYICKSFIIYIHGFIYFQYNTLFFSKLRSIEKIRGELVFILGILYFYSTLNYHF